MLEMFGRLSLSADRTRLILADRMPGRRDEWVVRYIDMVRLGVECKLDLAKRADRFQR